MGVCDVPVISTVCHSAGKAAASLVSAPFDWLAQAVGGAAKWMFETVWTVFDQTTLVSLTEPGYLHVYDILFGVAIFVMLLFFCLQLLTGLIRRDPTALSRAALGLAKSVLGSFVVVGLTGLALQITDELCTGIIQAAGQTTQSMGGKIALLAAGLTGINLTAPGAGAILTIFLAGLAVTGAMIVWFSLLVRKALLLVAVVFAPFAFAGSTWDATKGWVNKWSMFVLALICSKLVLVVMFLVAITQVSAPIDADLTSISQPIAGVVLMCMAAFAPYLTYKFIAFVGFDMYHAIGAEQDAKQALNRPIPVPGKPSSSPEPKKILDTKDGKGGSGPGGGGESTPPPASPGPDSTGPTQAGSGAMSTSGEAGIGSTGASSAGAGSAGAAAAGPAAAAVVGAQVVKAAATAGPKAGQAIGGQADSHADAAQTGNGGPAASSPAPAGPSTPVPNTPPAPSTPPPPPPSSSSSAPPQKPPSNPDRRQ